MDSTIGACELAEKREHGFLGPVGGSAGDFRGG